jgi:tRNA modification GTPase
MAEAVLVLDAPLVPRHATFSRVKGRGAGGPTIPDRGPVIDHVVATFFQQPASYTGEDVVEISGHGSPVVLRQIVAEVMAAGARLAEPGEFTLRAFLNGRLDLIQAEAVADLIDAATPGQARAAFDQLEGTLTERIGEIDAELFDLVARFEASLDFPEEGYHFVEPGAAADSIAVIEGRLDALLKEAARGRLIREGAQVAIVGKPNVGKSSLFNALVGAERAIVAPVPGTTRDFISERANLEGLSLTVIDTAGERHVANVEGEEGDDIGAVEREGVQRAAGVRSVADVLVVVLDRSRALDDLDMRMLEQTADTPRVIAANKNDLPEAWCAEALAVGAEPVVSLSAESGDGLEALRVALLEVLNGGGREGEGAVARDTVAVTNLRHIDLLTRAQTAVRRAREAVEAAEGRLPEEFVLADLQGARLAFEEITGQRTADDLLAHIFGRFCIGK